MILTVWTSKPDRIDGGGPVLVLSSLGIMWISHWVRAR